MFPGIEGISATSVSAPGEPSATVSRRSNRTSHSQNVFLAAKLGAIPDSQGDSEGESRLRSYFLPSLFVGTSANIRLSTPSMTPVR